ncbi:MAG: DNA mismatch endonuclease Vsr [Alphaproteobacteria bacterium]
MMSGIRGKNTKPELLVRRGLHSRGFRFTLHDRTLPGAPDIKLPKFRTVVFVHGCYWHHHKNCAKATTPSTNTKWWVEKIQGNVERDGRNVRHLLKEGWRVAVVWECGLVDRNDLLGKSMDRLENWIRGNDGQIVTIPRMPPVKRRMKEA